MSRRHCLSCLSVIVACFVTNHSISAQQYGTSHLASYPVNAQFRAVFAVSPANIQVTANPKEIKWNDLQSISPSLKIPFEAKPIAPTLVKSATSSNRTKNATRNKSPQAKSPRRKVKLTQHVDAFLLAPRSSEFKNDYSGFTPASKLGF